MNYERKAHAILAKSDVYGLFNRHVRKRLINQLAEALATENREAYAAGVDSEHNICITFNVTQARNTLSAVMKELGERVVQSTVDTLKRDKTAFAEECDAQEMELTDAFKTAFPGVTLQQLYAAGWTDSSLFAANYARRTIVRSGTARANAAIAKLKELQFTYNEVARQWVEPLYWTQDRRAAETLRNLGAKWNASFNGWALPRPSFASGGYYYPTVLPSHFNINMIDGMVHFSSGNRVCHQHIDQVPELRNLLARAVDVIVGAPAKA